MRRLASVGFQVDLLEQLEDYFDLAPLVVAAKEAVVVLQLLGGKTTTSVRRHTPNICIVLTNTKLSNTCVFITEDGILPRDQIIMHKPNYRHQCSIVLI